TTSFNFTQDVQMPVGGPYAIGPMTLNNNLIRAEIEKKILKLTSDISLLNLGKLVKIDGNLEWNFDKNIIESNGSLVIASMFNMTQTKSLIRYKKTGKKRKGITIVVDSSESPLKDILSFIGCLFTGENDCKDLLPKIDFSYCNPKVNQGIGLSGNELLIGCGTVDIFDGLLKADISLELTSKKIKFKIYSDLQPLFREVQFNFISDLLLLNPEVSGRVEMDLGITKAKISFSQSRTQASILAEALGISVGFVTPDLKEFDWEMLEDLLKKMLRLDIKDIKEAVKAILSGNLEINPASRFGRKSEGSRGSSKGSKGKSGSKGTSQGDFVSGYERGYSHSMDNHNSNNTANKIPTSYERGFIEGQRQGGLTSELMNTHGETPIVPPGYAYYEFVRLDDENCKYVVFKHENSKKIILTDKVKIPRRYLNNNCDNKNLIPIGDSLIFKQGLNEYAIFLSDKNIQLFGENGIEKNSSLSSLMMNSTTNQKLKQKIISLWGQCKMSSNCNLVVKPQNQTDFLVTKDYGDKKFYWHHLKINNSNLVQNNITEFRSS
ncbi:MAG: hypothetical protein KDC52_17785, partial [Ignavibacteriae bacterium]|nr:hypothetical protein [Ignavibacteriota bacterium]